MISAIERFSRLPWMKSMMLLFAALVTAWLTSEHYWLGYYDRVLWQTLVVVLLLLAAVTVWLGRAAAHHDLLIMPVLVFMALPSLLTMAELPAMAFHGLLVPPLLGYFCLRERSAHGLALLLGSIAGVVALAELRPNEAVRGLLQYVMITGSAACYTIMMRQRDAILDTLALQDWESTAYNQLQLDHVLAREVARAQYTARSVSLIAVQLDDYQQLREQNGDPSLLLLLPALVAAIRSQIRAGDDIFRCREDLFLLMLPGCPEDASIVLMERIRRHLHQQQWPQGIELSFMTTTVTSAGNENSEQLQKRLLTRIAKQKRASLQSLAF